MKKLMMFLTTMALAAGLVGFAPTSANAAPNCIQVGPYGSFGDKCIETGITVPNFPDVIQWGNPLAFRFNILSETNRDALGIVFFSLTWVRGPFGRSAAQPKHFQFKKKFKYHGDPIKVKTPDLKQVGEYVAVIKFKPKKGTRFTPSKQRETVSVER